MASRIIHLAIAKEITKEYQIKNADRFYLGSVLPDAALTKAAHFNKYIENNSKKTHNLTEFRNMYLNKILYDDLYLAYYLHLLEDIVFRYFMYTIIGYEPRPEGNIDKLHYDYKLINRYVIDKYRLDDCIRVPENIMEEPFMNDYQFNVYEFIDRMKKDYTDKLQGKTCFFTESMADKYIEMSVHKCLDEIEAVFNTYDYFNEDEYAWHRH